MQGGWFAIVVVIACGALVFGLGFALSHVIRLRHARRDRRQAMNWLREVSTRTLVEGNITLAGRWCGDALDTCGTRIPMVDWRGALPSDTRIGQGAPVLATGDLRREMASGDGSSAATRWSLVGATVYREDPKIQIGGVKRTTLLVLASVAALVAYSGLRILGDQLVDRAKHRDYLPGDGGPLVLTNLQSLSIAASLPGSRDDALDALASALLKHPYRDEASVERQRELARLQDGPCGATGFLKPSGRYDDELELARKCGHHQDVFTLELAKGDFARAWADRPPHLDWPFGEGMIAIAIANWGSAAEAAERMAKAYDHDAREHETRVKEYLHVDDLEERERTQLGYAKDAAHRFRCLASWFRVLGGDSSATQQLKTLATDPAYNPLVCAPIFAQTLIGEDRARYLLKLSPDPELKHSNDEWIVRTSLWIEGQDDPDRGITTPVSTTLAGEDFFQPSEFLLGLGVEAWRGKNAWSYITGLEGEALLAIQRGDLAAARKLAADALAVAQEAGDKSSRYLANQLASAVAVRTGDVPRAEVDESEPDGVRVRRGEDPQYEMKGYPLSCDSQFAQARIAAQAGDGRPLATALQSCNVYWNFSPQIVLGVLPLVKQGREELATALRWWSDTSTGLHEPFSSALRASLRRDMARMVGDTESAERWGRIATAFSQPLQDPTKRIALVLWGM